MVANELGHEPRDPGLPWRFAQGVGGGGGAHASPPAPPNVLKLERAFPGLEQQAILKALQRVDGDIAAHGFRSTFRDWCAESFCYGKTTADNAVSLRS